MPWLESFRRRLPMFLGLKRAERKDRACLGQTDPGFHAGFHGTVFMKR